MNKNKRFVKRFINHLFGTYKVPGIPVYVCYGDKEFNIGSKKHLCGFYDGNKKRIYVAGKIGTTKIIGVIAHEFIHYLQDIHGRDMTNTAELESDANYWSRALFAQWIINKTVRNKHCYEVYPIWERAPKDAAAETEGR